MLKRLMATSDDLGLTILRIVLGVVMFPHGAQKALGWFGGGGWDATIGFFSGQLGVPAAATVLVILGELIGSIGLIAGLLTRIAAIGILVIQLGAVVLVHLEVGFFMDWFGNQQGEGYEYALLAMSIALVLVLKGGGTHSIDRSLANRHRR
jgi:putative oxidoreductase